jgi:hypothetical protein
LKIEIEYHSKSLEKYEKIRIDSWCRKFSFITNNQEWKKNRNFHAISLLNMLINKRVEEPYSRLPPDGPLPILSKILVKSKLSREFFKQTKYIYDPNSSPPERLYKEIKDEKLKSNNSQNKINKNAGNLKIKNNKKDLKNNKIDNKFKIKRAKTPTMKHTNLNNLNSQKNIIRNDNNNKDIGFINNSNNLSNHPVVRQNENNIKNDCLNYFNNSGSLNYSENIQKANEDEVNILRETIFKLEEELNKKERIIELQREERVKLSLKVEQLEKMFESIYQSNNF